MPEADELLCLAKLPVIGYRSDSYRTLLGYSLVIVLMPVLVVLIAIRFALANYNYSNTSVELILNAARMHEAVRGFGSSKLFEA